MYAQKQTEEMLHAVTKSCATLIEQTYTKPEKLQNLSSLNQGILFHLNHFIIYLVGVPLRPTIWRIQDDVLFCLGKFISPFNTSEQNKKFEPYRSTINRAKPKKFSHEDLKIENEKEPDLSVNNLEDNELKPYVFEKLKNSNFKDKKLMKNLIYVVEEEKEFILDSNPSDLKVRLVCAILLQGFAKSIFQDIEVILGLKEFPRMISN